MNFCLQQVEHTIVLILPTSFLGTISSLLSHRTGQTIRNLISAPL
jgi:hypothetical protein